MEKKYGNTPYSTKVTSLNGKFGLRIFRDGKIVDESIVDTKREINQEFRSMFRMIDKCFGGDKFTNEVRHRNHWKSDKIEECNEAAKIEGMPLQHVPLVINDPYILSRPNLQELVRKRLGFNLGGSYVSKE